MVQRVSKKNNVLYCIADSDIELFPKQIAKELGLNHSTVRNYCRSLLDEGKIIQPYLGSYASKITHGMMIAPIRVHNVILTADYPELKFSEDIVERIGDVKIRVQFGLQRKNLTIRISCKKGSKGMTRDTFLLALRRGYDIIEEFTEYSPKNFVLKTFELNRDIAGVRIDGVKCFTRKGFEGFVDRIYQKDGSVRGEIKVSGKMDIQQLDALLLGGTQTSSVVQGQFILVNEVRKLTRAVIQQQSEIKSLYHLVMGRRDKWFRDEPNKKEE